MHTPRPLEPSSPFHAGGFNPAVNLTEALPQGVAADVLLLGCGDARDILYTSAANRLFPERKLDITACDVDEHSLAKTIMFFTLLLDDDESVPREQVWNTYFHFYLDERDVEVLGTQAKKLLRLSSSWQEWHAGPYADTLRFCDEKTLSVLGPIWAKYAEQAGWRDPSAQKAHRDRFQEKLSEARKKHDCEKRAGKQDVARACSPLAMCLAHNLLPSVEKHWETGLTGSPTLEKSTIPNPVFSVPLTGTSTLKYPTSPLLGFHLAAAHARLAENSPLRIEDEPEGDVDWEARLLQTARVQFDEWTSAFIEAAPRTIVRFTASECFTLCHTLRYNLESGETCAQHYRTNSGFDVLTLAESEYGVGGTAPKQFDIIDTSTLSHDVGVLNFLVSAAPLLKASPTSTLYTAGLHKLSDAGAGFEQLLYGYTTPISLLLGLVPAEYWTNMTAMSTVDQVLAAWGDDDATPQAKDTLFGYRLSWKQSEYMSGQLPRAPLRAELIGLVALGQSLYYNIFSTSNPLDPPAEADRKTLIPRKAAQSQYHTGSLLAFLEALADRTAADSNELCKQFLQVVASDTDLVSISAHLAAFSIDVPISGLAFAEQAWGWQDFATGVTPGFKNWADVPRAVALTVVIPPDRWQPFIHGREEDGEGINVACHASGHLRVDKQDTRGGDIATIYSDTQIGFGSVETEGSPDEDGFVVRVVEDEAGWAGNSPMILSYYVSSEYLGAMFAEAVVGFHLRLSTLSTSGTEEPLETALSAFEVSVSDTDKVFISKYRPGQTGHEVTEGNLRELQKSKRAAQDPASPDSTFTAFFDLRRDTEITAIEGRLNITSDEGKKLLADKVPITIDQPSPFTLTITFDKEKPNPLVLPLTFPAPILREGITTRVARTSHYIELLAPLAQPHTHPDLLSNTFLLPTTLPPNGGPPATLNLPHLSLSTLPILNLSSPQRHPLTTLTTLTSLTFSSRERPIRAANFHAESRTHLPARLNLKESLFTMFMLASGLQGGQTGLFGLNHPSRGGLHILLLVSALRLDGAHGNVVLDVAVLPLTTQLVRDGAMEEFLLVLRELECCVLDVDDAELEAWKRALPAMVERCRTWQHKEGCEYVTAGRVPISLEHGEPVLCQCGVGAGLEDGFVSIPGWETASKHATRAAISLLFASPLVEEGISPAKARIAADELMGRRLPRRKCVNCGGFQDVDGVKLRRCAKCLMVEYCSAECQKADWKKHRAECKRDQEMFGLGPRKGV
ncbi:hypothetical protein C8A05DRAFT_18536 [Staphylotrichum tortipilum]|uniref:MYND-type domain-containing protein n=1 Tax=Staphylotrichum tortipilum TaxID=2831512 RepID=A0AAN6RQZ4_9PEZI|nr:hypothetical protein C8A05DRAFT_18536 [Staphylotrichum longicolle]